MKTLDDIKKEYVKVLNDYETKVAEVEKMVDETVELRKQLYLLEEELFKQGVKIKIK